MDPDPAGYCGYLLLLQHAPAPLFDSFAIALQWSALALLMLAAAILSGSEVALFSLDSASRTALARSGDRSGARVLHLLEQPRSLMITIRIVGTLTNIAAAILATFLTGNFARSWAWTPSSTLWAQIFALTIVLVVTGEILPKFIAARYAPSFSRRSSRLLYAAHRVLRPISSGIAHSMKPYPSRPRYAAAPSSPSQDLRDLVDVGEGAGVLDEAERDLLNAVVDLADTTVREVMVSRLDMVALPLTSTLREAVESMRSSGHSRLPLFDEHLDNILGVVYMKDLLPLLVRPEAAGRWQAEDWVRVARPALYVPHGKRLDHLLKDFQAQKTHIAVVVDEYGGTDGLVTMEDILEEIVGDIRDEHDEREVAYYERIDEHTVRFDARINLDEMNEILGTELDTEAFDFETLGGLIFHLTGAVPEAGEKLNFENLHLVVESVEAHRIGHILVTVARPVGADDPGIEEEELH